MPLVPTAGLVADAVRERRGIGAFNVITLEHAEAISAAAAAARLPLLLQVSENAIAYHGGDPGPLSAACVAVARACPVPVGLHLDHVTDRGLARRAAGLGYGSVMFDASTLPYEDNVAATAAVARSLHRDGLWVEAELGEVGGKDGAHAPGVRTDPDEATAFVAATGVDGLAVAVGSSHAMSEATAVLDLDLVRQLRQAVPVPLVLHGSSGVPPGRLTEAVRAGIVKVNVGTALNLALTVALRDLAAGAGLPNDPRRYLGPGRDAMTEAVVRYVHALAAS